MEAPKIDKYDQKSGFFYENRVNLINIYDKCLKRINNEHLFDYESKCVENYTKILIEAAPIVQK